jgi:hypothetical protein
MVACAMVCALSCPVWLIAHASFHLLVTRDVRVQVVGYLPAREIADGLPEALWHNA